jgi:ribonuclease VapC
VIIDSSALVAILKAEPDAGLYTEALERSDDARVSAATSFETTIVVGPGRHVDLDDLLVEGAVTVVPFDEEQARLARAAYARYGKGSGSPAGLNFGDCFSYALAKTTGMPLLFKGNNFTHTDVVPALQ